MVLDELSSMSRFKGSKPVPPSAFTQPGVGVMSPPPKPLSPSITRPTVPAKPTQVQTPWRRVTSTLRQADLDNPLRKLGLYLALAFIFCRFSLFGELVAT